MILNFLLLAFFLPLRVLTLSCKKSGVYLECNNLDLSKLLETYNNEDTLRLTNITWTTDWDSQKMAPVNTLTLNNVNFSTIAFREMFKMQHLSTLELNGITSNEIIEITNDFIPPTTNLRRLKINKCEKCNIDLNLTILSELVISASKFEKPVKISGEKLQFLKWSAMNGSTDIEISLLPNLQEMDFSFNDFNDSAMEKIANLVENSMPELEKLMLGNNSITKFSLSSETLKVLDLNKNQLENIDPTTFSKLPKLTTLLLDDNAINQMTDPFDFNVELKLLDLSQNKLESINGSLFKSITKLEVLKLSHNSIKNLPKLMTELRNLHHLNLALNQLETLNPEFFIKTPALAFLDVSNNKLSNIDTVTPYLQSITRLLIGENMLQISSNTFSPMINLNYLNASHNQLTNTLSVFNNNSALRNLYLNSNNIQQICDGKTLKTHVDYLFLQHNQIKSLDCLEKVRYIDVTHNPLECNENLKMKLIELADSVDFPVPITDVEVFNHSKLEFTDGETMFENLCVNVSTESTTEILIIKPPPPVLESEPDVNREPAEDTYTYTYSEDDDNETDEFMNDDDQSQKDSFMDLDNNIKYNYHVRPLSGLAFFGIFTSVALFIVLIAILGTFIHYKIRERKHANLGSDRPYKQLKNEVYKSTTSGVDNGHRNIAQVFSKFKNDKLDEIMVKFGFKWQNFNDNESQAKMIPA